MLVVVGGHSRNIGKTSVMASIIRATRDLEWQAIKLTQHGHGICSKDGKPCDCAPGDATHPYVLDAQTTADGTDSGRYLAAGASRSWWLRTAVGQLGDAMPAMRKLLTECEHTIVESNSLIRFLKPDLYIVVLDYSVADIKDSARLYMDRADAFAMVPRERMENPWGVPERWIRSKPVFAIHPPDYGSEALTEFVRARVNTKV
ncbi:MAG: hypothetical protein JNL98_10885 [Bryobacterales bacterium]|nr:hypothetical protein [Bryobacterales bacterium]